MLKRSLNKLLRADESLIRIVHPSWVHYWRQLGGWSLLFAAALFFATPLYRMGQWGAILLFFLLCGSLIGIFHAFLLRFLNGTIITSERIIDIDQRGIFERHVAECPLALIQNIRYTTSGFLSTLFHVGTVVAQCGISRGRIACVDVPHPEEVKELLLTAQRQHIKDDSLEQVQQYR